MKRSFLLFLTLFLLIANVVGVGASAPAQTAETIWITTDKVTFSGDEPVRVMILANSATPIQGFSFRLQYDPACLQVKSSDKSIAQLSNMSMKQEPGIVEGIYTSTEPITINGQLVEVQFVGIKECTTALQLASASLMALNADRIAVELEGITVDKTPVNIGFSSASSQPAATAQSIAVLDDPNQVITEDPTAQAAPGSMLTWYLVGGGALIALLLAGAIALLVVLIRKRTPRTPILPTPARARAGSVGMASEPLTAKKTQSQILPAGTSAFITIQRGIQAGTRIRLAQFPCALGNSPANDIYLEDPSIAAFHAKIYADKNGYTLIDMGNSFGTYVNGKFHQNELIPLKSGDAIKIGSILMTFTVV